MLNTIPEYSREIILSRIILVDAALFELISVLD